jgi:hypothetical protein
MESRLKRIGINPGISLSKPEKWGIYIRPRKSGQRRATTIPLRSTPTPYRRAG